MLSAGGRVGCRSTAGSMSRISRLVLDGIEVVGLWSARADLTEAFQFAAGKVVPKVALRPLGTSTPSLLRWKKAKLWPHGD